jgi:predicted nucleic acid-binding protein
MPSDRKGADCCSLTNGTAKPCNVRCRSEELRLNPKLGIWEDGISHMYPPIIASEIDTIMDQNQGLPAYWEKDRQPTGTRDVAQHMMDLQVHQAERFISDHTSGRNFHVPTPRSDRDALIGATAMVHGMKVVTRNASHFEPTGVGVVDPWNS